MVSVSRVVVGLTRIGPRSEFFVFGGDPAERVMRAVPVVAGRAVEGGRPELMIGESASRQLRIRPGDRIEVMREKLTVVGVYRTGRALFDNAGMMDLDGAQSLFRMGGNVTLAFLGVASPDHVDAVLGSIRRTLPQLAAKPSDLFASSFQRLGVIHRFARYLALLALFVSALSLSNTLSMNAVERRQEFAILRAVGWHRGRIAAMVVTEAVMLIGAGALLAIPLASVLLRFFSAADLIGVVPPVLPLETAGEGLAATLLIGLLLSMIPLAQVLRMRPADALRAL